MGIGFNKQSIIGPQVHKNVNKTQNSVNMPKVKPAHIYKKCVYNIPRAQCVLVWFSDKHSVFVSAFILKIYLIK